MKAKFKPLTLALIVFLSLSSLIKKHFYLENEVVTLELAVKEKSILFSIKATGSYSGKSLQSEIKNLKHKPIKLVFPAGTLFNAPSEDEQDLILPQEQFVFLKPNEKKQILLDGFCTNLNNHAPKQEGKFALVPKLENKQMNRLLTYINRKKFEPHTLQDAIWSITNNNSVTNIYGTNEQEVASLRKELFAITGQKEEWYQSPQNTQLNEDRTINRETASIKGGLVYQAHKGSKVHTEVLSPEGEVRIKSKDILHSYNGELTFHFEVQVTGWKKGKYKVNIVENSKVIQSYDFNV